jgi:hypothetical protein
MVTISSIVLPVLFYCIMSKCLINTILNLLLTFFCVIISIYFFGVTKHEREKILFLLIDKIKK